MVDETKKYFFYNVYGDADELLASKPDDVIAIPFGWTEEIESSRNDLMKELDLNVTALPSLVFWGRSYEFTTERGIKISYPQRWEEVRVGTLEKPWNWDDIQLCIDEFMKNPMDGVPSGIAE